MTLNFMFEFSENFLGFRRFWTQQHLNEWRYTIAMLVARLSATAGLSRRQKKK